MINDTPRLDSVAWNNGQWCSLSDLKVSILDLGLVHCDATYDVMAFVNNHGFRINEHICRFIDSCKYWRIPLNMSESQLVYLVNEVHLRTSRASSIVWLSITRGIPSTGNTRDFKNCVPNLMCYAKPYQMFNGNNMARVCLADQLRVPDCAINQRHKNFVWADLTRAQWEAIDRGYDTAVLLGVDGFLTEGPGFNVAIIKDQKVKSPQSNCLNGISMKHVQQLCRKHHIDFEFCDIDKHQLETCDDMFLTTTIGNLVTVTDFNGRLLNKSHIQETLKGNFL